MACQKSGNLFRVESPRSLNLRKAHSATYLVGGVLFGLRKARPKRDLFRSLPLLAFLISELYTLCWKCILVGTIPQIPGMKREGILRSTQDWEAILEELCFTRQQS